LNSVLENLKGIILHPIFLTVAVAWAVAQMGKVVLEFSRSGRIRWSLMVETGGMPSSHSSFVSSLAASVGMKEGWTSSAFMVALGMAIIIMHDAAGLRMAAGRQAALLNQVVGRLYGARKVKGMPRMKEMLGHSPLQVISGALLGVAVAFLLFPPLNHARP
jgi:acid phosphatase family membrane protein YuiD